MDSGFIIFVNRQKHTLPGPMTGADLLAATNFPGTGYDLLQLQGEGDPSGGRVVPASEMIAMKNGLHFRVVPGNRTFGGIPAELVAHVQELEQQTGYKVSVEESGGRVYVVISPYTVPTDNYAARHTDLMFITDQQYPLSAIDMFYVGIEVVLRDGRVPRSAETIEHHLGRPWRRFSWHRNGRWRANGNGLLDHLAFVETRWAAEGQA